MAFLDNIGKKISDVSQSTIQKSKELADSAKYKSLISDEEKKITNTHTQMGKLYAELHADAPEEAFAGFMEALKASKEKIEEYEQKLIELKGVSRCPSCGAEVPNGSLFCATCGTKMAQPSVEVPSEEVQSEAAPAVMYCTSCGAVVPNGSKFCTVCGHPMAVE